VEQSTVKINLTRWHNSLSETHQIAFDPMGGLTVNIDCFMYNDFEISGMQSVSDTVETLATSTY
jgi:hypothetical protein